MDDLEFCEACSDVYRRALATGKTKAQALREHEKFRSDTIITLARLADRRRADKHGEA